VADNWVNFISQNFEYPLSGASAAIKKKATLEGDWVTYKYQKILGPYETYEIARNVEKMCVDISSSDEVQFAALSEQTLPELPSKRIGVKKRFYEDDKDTNCLFSFFVLL